MTLDDPFAQSSTYPFTYPLATPIRIRLTYPLYLYVQTNVPKIYEKIGTYSHIRDSQIARVPY